MRSGFIGVHDSGRPGHGVGGGAAADPAAAVRRAGDHRHSAARTGQPKFAEFRAKLPTRPEPAPDLKYGVDEAYDTPIVGDTEPPEIDHWADDEPEPEQVEVAPVTAGRAPAAPEQHELAAPNTAT